MSDLPSPRVSPHPNVHIDRIGYVGDLTHGHLRSLYGMLPTTESPAVRVGVRLFRQDARLPERQTTEAAGWDVHAYCREEADDDSLLYTSTKDDPQMGWLPTDRPGVYSYLTTLAIPPGRTRVVPTGINLRIPAGWEVQVRSRSGLAAKNGVTVLNAPGTIDSDYSGDGESFEAKVILTNLGTREFQITHGMRIAQFVVKPVPFVDFYEDDEMVDRAAYDRQGGFGSTDVKAQKEPASV